MLKIIFAVGIAMTIPMSAQAEGTYTIDKWPRDIDKLPCSAFKKDTDDAWTLVATVRVDSVSGTMSGYTLGRGLESHMIENKCGK
jgi:hypothetical protein